MTAPYEIQNLAQLDLARYIRPGDGIVVAQGTGEPLGLTAALVEQRARYSGAGVFLGTGFSPTFQPGHADHLRFTSIGSIGTLRKLAAAGVLDTIPCHFSSIEPLLRERAIRSDIVLLQVSPPNARGEYSFGLVNDYLRTAMRCARTVIAEINHQVPWTHCQEPLQPGDIHVAVHTDRVPLELPPAPFGELERRIAAYLSDAIPERATLQVGIGAIPEAVVSMLSGRRGLGLHSGMLGDSALDLIEAGAVTNAHKGMDAGVSVAGVLFGTRRLYRFAHQNPQLMLCHSSHTHAIGTLSRLNRFVSINSALEVDLSGQVNAEAIGADYIGAVGGQVDFVRAAAQSPQGVSIIALAATGKGGASKIVHRLSGPVTTARSDVDIVATEHGMVRLRGLPLSQRARALAGIAAPQHREALLRAAGV